MARRVQFGKSIERVLELPAAPYLVASAPEGSAMHAPLAVGIVHDSRLLIDAQHVWEAAAVESGVAAPSFHWASVGTFRSRDPIVAIYWEGRPRNGVQALMQLRETYKVPCSLGVRDPLVYVSFLEVAPWNRANSRSRVLRTLGQLMLRFACQRSRQRGYDGRIGLHALPGAESFYRSLGFSMPICPNEYKELYFELEAGAAPAFLISE